MTPVGPWYTEKIAGAVCSMHLKYFSASPLGAIFGILLNFIERHQSIIVDSSWLMLYSLYTFLEADSSCAWEIESNEAWVPVLNLLI